MSVTPPVLAALRRQHHLFAASIFAVLGFHVGVWAVQLAPLTLGLGLDPAMLGTALTVAAAAGVITLLTGGLLIDRYGHRLVLVAGLLGAGAAFALLSVTSTVTGLLIAVLLYGLTISFVDLGANTVGSAYEQTHRVTAMTGLHAWFSGGALVGALGCGLLLWYGLDYRQLYLGLAAVMSAAAVGCMLGPAPARPIAPADTAGDDGAAPGAVWRIPAVLFATLLIAITFFGDGALESFLAVYLQETLAGGVLLSGLGIGAFHLASLMGRVSATAMLRRFGERRVVIGAGLLAAAGLAFAVAAPGAGLAIIGLLVVGFALAPIVPTGLSLAGRSAPGRSGKAISVATAAGYSAFIISPATIGLLAQATSLRLALAGLVVTSLAIAVLATRWPRTE